VEPLWLKAGNAKRDPERGVKFNINRDKKRRQRLQGQKKISKREINSNAHQGGKEAKGRREMHRLQRQHHQQAH